MTTQESRVSIYIVFHNYGCLADGIRTCQLGQLWPPLAWRAHSMVPSLVYGAPQWPSGVTKRGYNFDTLEVLFPTGIRWPAT